MCKLVFPSVFSKFIFLFNSSGITFPYIKLSIKYVSLSPEELNSVTITSLSFP